MWQETTRHERNLRIWDEQLDDFVPERVLDFHVHVWDRATVGAAEPFSCGGHSLDEYDFDEGTMILQRSEYEYTAKAQVDIEDFNEHFGSRLDDEDFDTIGGLVTHAIGHLPKRGEKAIIDRFEFRVIRADSRKVRLLNVRVLSPAEQNADATPD